MAAPSVVNEERISSIPKYVNGVLETTFCSQITFGLVGWGQVWKGGYPVESTPYLPFYYIFPPEFEISQFLG